MANHCNFHICSQLGIGSVMSVGVMCGRQWKEMEIWMHEKPIKGDIICDVSVQLTICSGTDQWRKLLEDLFSVN